MGARVAPLCGRALVEIAARAEVEVVRRRRLRVLRREVAHVALDPLDDAGDERVAAVTYSAGGIRTPATSPTNAVPVGSCRKLTWCQACPGVYSTRKSSSTVSPPRRTCMLASGTGTTSPHSRASPSSPP